MLFKKSSHEDKKTHVSSVGKDSIRGNITLTWSLAFQSFSWLVTINNVT